MTLRRIDDVFIASAPLEDVADDRLSAAERALAAAARSSHRVLELRAGRAVAREALRAFHPHADFSVLADASGRPNVHGAPAFISIAHSRTRVVAAASTNPVGLDVEPFERAERLADVVSSLCARGRATRISGDLPCSWPEAMLLWTAWEAMGKLDTTGVLGGAMKRVIRTNATDADARADLFEGFSEGVRLRWWIDADHVHCLATKSR